MSCGIISYTLSITGDCSNTNSGAVFLEFTGSSAPPYTVTEVSTSGLFPTSTGVDYSVNGLPAGNYTILVEDFCLSPGPTEQYINIYISSGSCLSIETSGTTCGFDNGSVDVTFNNFYGLGSVYLYDISNNLIESASTTTAAFNFTTSLSAGTYYVVGDDGGGCTGRSESCIIYSSTSIDYGFYIVNNSSCNSAVNNGKIFITGLTGNPPYTYLWSPNGETTSSIIDLPDGIYSVTVTDNNGCTLTKTAVVNPVPPITIASMIPVQPTCFTNDGQVTVNIVGGTGPFFYSGSNGDTIVTFANSYTFTNLAHGIFSVVVQDAGLCTTTNSVLLINPNSFIVASIATSNSTCSNNNGSITINLSGGVPSGSFTYDLYDSFGNLYSNFTGLATCTFNGVQSGTYTLEISNGSPCVYTTTITITNSDLFTVTAITTDTTCGFNNGSVILSATTGGLVPYSYEITGYPSQPVPTFSNLSPGNYIGTVSDSGGCVQVVGFTIAPSTTLYFDLFTVPTIIGNDGQIQVLITSGEPPFTYNWSPNVNGQVGPYVTNLTAGTYSVIVTDSDGCSLTKTTTITGTELLSSTQLFTICDSNFQNTGIVGRRGMLQMLNEGFYDLTFDDTNCILNTADFKAQVSVDGEIKEEIFYISFDLNDYPTDEEWVIVINNLLLQFPGIGNVEFDLEQNTIKIVNDCNSINKDCKPTNSNSLADAKVLINLLIDYDISCEYCGLPPTPTPSPTPTTTPTSTPVPTATPIPTATPVPTATPIPTATPTSTPTPVPVYPFVTTWESTISAPFGIKLPLISPVNGGVYNFTVDWGDGTPIQTVNSWNSPNAQHLFPGPGPYTVTINGQIEGWSFNGGGSAREITSVLSWGPLKLGNKAFNFFGCPRLTLDTVIDVLDLTGVTNLTRMFAACQNLVTINNVELWDTSLIQVFDAAFEKCQLFNDNLSDWNMSSTTSLKGMFRGCLSFNNDGSSLINTQWDVSNVTDMSYMFQFCNLFNQPIGSWDVGLVQDMKYMFDGCDDFNQNISSWNVQNVQDMLSMFRGAIHFEQNIGSWNIQNVTDMNFMFTNVTLSTTNYNALLIGWAAQTVQPNVTFDAGNSQYTIAIAGAAKATLTSGPNNWVISDGGGI